MSIITFLGGLMLGYHVGTVTEKEREKEHWNDFVSQANRRAARNLARNRRPS